MRAMFCRQQRERKLDVFFPAKKAKDVCRAVVILRAHLLSIFLRQRSVAANLETP
jgi:hypothetical protein